MPPVQHGDVTLNDERSRCRRDNSRRYDIVALDFWENGEVVETKIMDFTGNPVAIDSVRHLINGINSGKITRFDL